MKREEFVQNCAAIGVPMDEMSLREKMASKMNAETDVYVCIGELSELINELTDHLRGKMDRENFLQELSHVQWAVWSLQEIFKVSDEEVRRGVQASFR